MCERRTAAECCQIARVDCVSHLQWTVLLVQGRQRRLQVENGNPAAAVPVNGSLPPQRHHLLERLVARDDARAALDALWESPSFHGHLSV